MRTYTLLVSADTYRDGGSLEARFACADGSFETIWLKADSFDGVRCVHTELITYADPDRQGVGRPIAKNSDEEEAIVAALYRFLQDPKVNVPFSQRTPDEIYLKVVETLLSSIPDRVPDGAEGPGANTNTQHWW